MSHHENPQRPLNLLPDFMEGISISGTGSVIRWLLLIVYDGRAKIGKGIGIIINSFITQLRVFFAEVLPNVSHEKGTLNMPQKSQEKPQLQPPQKQDQKPGHELQMNPLPQSQDPEYRASGKLQDKVALITGGDSGIGRSVAIYYAKEGADAAIVYPNEHEDAQETKRLVEQEGRRCLLIPGDIGDESLCQQRFNARWTNLEPWTSGEQRRRTTPSGKYRADQRRPA